MAVNIKQSYTVHPMGMGFFYTGEITINSKENFTFVFDCGSMNKEENKKSVIEYNNRLVKADKKIDLLVISHFDADHVNLLEELFENGIEVKNIVLPFTSIAERLILVLSRIFTSELEYENYLKLLFDPLTYLRETINSNTSPNIYFMESSGNKPPKTDDILPQDPVKFFYEKNEALRMEEYENVGESSDVYKVFDDNIGLFKISNNNQDYYMKFIFYRHQVSTEDNDFYNEVLFLVKKIYKENDVFKILKLNFDDFKSSRKLKEIYSEILNNNNYRKSYKNFNKTALCMLHFLDNITIKSYESISINNTIYINNFKKLKKNSTAYSKIFPNTMLTSDSFLISDEDIKKFRAHYEKFIDKVFFLQVPHHGSHLNSNSKLYESFEGKVQLFVNCSKDKYKRKNIFKHIKKINHYIVDKQKLKYCSSIFSDNEKENLIFIPTLDS